MHTSFRDINKSNLTCKIKMLFLDFYIICKIVVFYICIYQLHNNFSPNIQCEIALIFTSEIVKYGENLLSTWQRIQYLTWYPHLCQQYDEKVMKHKQEKSKVTTTFNNKKLKRRSKKK